MLRVEDVLPALSPTNWHIARKDTRKTSARIGGIENPWPGGKFH